MRQSAALLLDVLGRLRPDAVGVRVVGAPHQRVGRHQVVHVDQLRPDDVVLERRLALTTYSVTEIIYPDFVPSSINDAGLVVGTKYELGRSGYSTLPSAQSALASSVNNFGVIVGSDGGKLATWSGSPPVETLYNEIGGVDIDDRGNIICHSPPRLLYANGGYTTLDNLDLLVSGIKAFVKA